MLLSKSSFIRSLQCQKSLYLHKYHGHLRDAVSREQQAIFDRGHSVGFLAQSLFPGGMDAGWKSPRQYKRSVRLTRHYMESGKKVIYEAAFLWENVLVAVDILVREADGWHAYEVKSSLQASETFLRDAALQHYVITQSGLPLSGFSLVHLNRDYRRGSQLDLNGLFKVVDVKDQIAARQPLVVSGLEKARQTVRSPFIPESAIGPHCETPYPCDFRGHCWEGLNNEKPSIFDLTELEEERKWKLYSDGTRRLADIPQTFPLTRHQRIQYDCIKGNTIHVEKEELRKAVSHLAPAFLHLAMARPGIPLLPRMGPYHQAPFAFSLRKQDSPREAVYIGQPEPALIENWLRKFLFETEGLDSIITYGQAPEIRALKFIAREYPALQKDLEARLNKITDLAEIFQRKLFYHALFATDTSLRTALSVFGIDHPSSSASIQSSNMAGTAFENLFTEQDMFRTMDIREKISAWCLAQASGIEALYFAVQKEAMEEHDSLGSPGFTTQGFVTATAHTAG